MAADEATRGARASGGGRGKISTLLAVVVALPFLTSILAAALAVSQQRRQEAGTAQLARAFEVRRVTQGVLTQLLDLESSQRGYVLTGHRGFLETFEAARSGVPEALRRLAALVGADPAQSARVSDLARVGGARVALAAEIVDAVSNGAGNVARDLVESGRGKALTDQARALVTAIDDDEEALLLARQADLTDASVTQARNLGALVSASAITLAVLILIVRRMLAYHDVVRMCAWSRTIEYQGEWLSFEEYLAKRFGIQTARGMSPDAARRVRLRTAAVPDTNAADRV